MHQYIKNDEKINKKGLVSQTHMRKWHWIYGEKLETNSYRDVSL